MWHCLNDCVKIKIQDFSYINPIEYFERCKMKKIFAILCASALLLTIGLSLCACGSELDNSVKSANKQIKAYNDPEKYPHGGVYSGELIHHEAEDTYDYVITVDVATYTGGSGYADKVENLVYNMEMSMSGYFSDNENVTVYVKVYNGSEFIREYKNWELVTQ